MTKEKYLELQILHTDIAALENRISSLRRKRDGNLGNLFDSLWGFRDGSYDEIISKHIYNAYDEIMVCLNDELHEMEKKFEAL